MLLISTITKSSWQALPTSTLVCVKEDEHKGCFIVLEILPNRSGLTMDTRAGHSIKVRETINHSVEF